ncbi:MAG: DUF2281 domain-containing protein [Candidatus Aenigmatarchaeota archaeon]|nr:MAG: DUF2281 domain-containing protein [Candidatus Aenigmarchaeota archaeon]
MFERFVKYSQYLLLIEVLDFLRFLREKSIKQKMETALLSEKSLGRDWLLPEENEAWRDL